jgi:hypothetical protein
MSEHSIPFPAESRATLDVEERRSLERYICRRQTTVRVLAKPSLRSFSAIVRDISMLGIGLLVDQPFEPGTMLALQLRSRHARFSGILTGIVKHCTRQPEGDWLLGCSLTRSLTDDEVLGLL